MKLPYAEVEFDKKGALVEPDEVRAANDLIAEKNATDVIVISHGWNNTPASARQLYERLVDSIVAVRSDVDGASDRRLVVIGVIWPSIQWAPPENDGAGAGVGDEKDDLQTLIAVQIEDAARRKKLQTLVPSLETSAEARASFVELLRGKLPAGATDDDDPDSAPEALATADAQTVFDAAGGAGEDDAAPAAPGGGADVDPMGLPPLDDGGAAGFDFGGVIDAARNVLNVTTYYTMKERAGVVGTKGIAALLGKLHTAAPGSRLHLVGHSFGGRAVTAAALATSAAVSSICLLQAAYSHYGMAKGWDGGSKDGIFVAVPAKVKGPIIVTFTKNDKAVGLAYPIASRIANQIGVGIGDENDKYGGIGRNGALKTPAELPVVPLQEVGGAYHFGAGKVSSLQADAFVKGHSDITGRQVAYAVLSAVLSAVVSAP